MTQGQDRALQQLWSTYGLELDAGCQDLAVVFANGNPCILDLGFGMGESLVESAANMRDHNFIGVDVYQPGVAHVMANLQQQSLSNVRLFCADATKVLNDAIADASLAQINIFFADPWPKKRHNKRRLIQVDFVQLLESKLQPGGVLHLATDWEDYADHMLNVMAKCQNFKQENIGMQHVRPENRPVTKYERRAIRLGHKIWDFIFCKHSEL
jgi:tRNA (guanine-N7-)-methyltransferase